MAKNKKKGGRQGFVSKGINIGLIALGFSRALELLFTSGGFVAGAKNILYESTFGLSSGKFDWKAGARMYSPGGAAAGLGMLKRYLMKKFPVRR